MLGRTDFELFPREQSDFFRQKDLEMFRSGSLVSIEEENVTDVRGVTHVMSTKKVPLRDETGEVMHLVGIMHEITELRAAQEDLRRANEELEHRVAQRTLELRNVQEELLRQERVPRRQPITQQRVDVVVDHRRDADAVDRLHGGPRRA